MVAEDESAKHASKKHSDAIPQATPVDSWYFNSRGCAMSISFLWTFTTGVSVALAAFLPSLILAAAQDKKYEYYDDAMEKQGIGGVVGLSILVSVLFAGISAFIVAYFGRSLVDRACHN